MQLPNDPVGTLAEVCMYMLMVLKKHKNHDMIGSKKKKKGSKNL